MQCLEHERGELELDPESDRQPVHFPQSGCDEFTTTCPLYQPGCCILYWLQSLSAVADTVQYRDAVMQALKMNAWTNVFVASSDNDRSVDLICLSLQYAERQTNTTRSAIVNRLSSDSAEVACHRADDVDSWCQYLHVWLSLAVLYLKPSHNICVLLVFRCSLLALIHTSMSYTQRENFSTTCTLSNF